MGRPELSESDLMERPGWLVEVGRSSWSVGLVAVVWQWPVVASGSSR